MKKIILSLLVGTTVLLTGCATSDPYYRNSDSYYGTQPTNTYGAYGNSNRNYNNYNNNQYNRGEYTETAIVYGVRSVNIGNNTSGVGLGVGAVAGGVIGNQIGKGSGRTLATIAGVVGGAVVGNQVEKNNHNNYRQGVELKVRVERTGQMLTITQPDNGEQFTYGSVVRLIYDSQNANNIRAVY